MASSDSGDDAAPAPSLTTVRSGLAGLLLVLALVAACVAIGLLILTTNGWTDVMEAPLRSPLWALVPVPIAVLAGYWGRRLVTEPFLSLNEEEVVVHRSGEEEDLLLPFASITESHLRGNNLVFKTVEDEEEDGSLTYGDFQVSLFGVPQPRRRLILKAIQGKVKAWDDANQG